MSRFQRLANAKAPEPKPEKPPEESVLASEHASEKPLAGEPATEIAGEQASNLASEQASKIAAPEGKKKSSRVQWNTRIPKQLAEQMEIWCFVHKLTHQEATERAFAILLASEQPSKRARIDNDMDEGLIEEEILVFYREWTGNRVTDGDRRAFDEVSMFRPDIIKAGILTTLFNARTSGRKVNSLRYCLQEIQAAGAAPIHDSRGRLQYLISKLREGK